ncbi:MAG: hypothetical protein GX633_00805 [Clostridiales bacterium]|nr:hypothetical protein [Clostridiales bacterium]
MKLDSFYTYNELMQELEEIEKAYPRYAKVQELTKSREGRMVPIITLADFSLSDALEKPAYYMQANIHAQEPCGTNVAMYFIYEALKSPGKLSRHIYYIVPRINPDGAERAITKRDNNIRSCLIPLDVENALMPQDIDGDGLIATMRRVNPMGNWKILNKRGIMVERRPGDTEGTFYDLFPEGYIENYTDGNIKSGERSVDLNRSYPAGWKPLPFSSDYPGQEPEIRAVLEFLTSRKNIFAGVDLHNGTSAILRPTGRTNEQLPREDRSLMKELCAKASEITGFQDFFDVPYGAVPGEKSAELPGCACDFWYEVLGLSHYTIELGNGYNSIGMKSLDILSQYGDLYGELLEKVQVYHEERGSTVFLPWKKFDHPQLGEVEVGGMIGGQAYHIFLPDMEKFAPKVCEFMFLHSEMYAKLFLGNVSSLKVADNVWRITAECMNTGKFGTQVMQGSPGHLGKIPLESRLEGGEILNKEFTRSIPQLRSMEKISLEWFVRAKTGTEITVTVSHPKAENAIAKLILE